MVQLVKQDYEKNKKIYKEVESNLRKKLDKNIQIEHVGSTAIPSMYGKNIIDILIGAKDKIEFDKIKIVLESVGFISSDKSRTDIYQFFASKATETSQGDIHIHLVIENTERFHEFLILKNYLLNNKEEAKKYSDFKKEILNNEIIDRSRYKKIKSEYVSDLINKAKHIETI